jgi:hypothetical protein
MEALNKKERNSAILRFSMWLFLSVVIICLPVLLSVSLSKGKNKINKEEYKSELSRLTSDVNFVKDTFAVNLQRIEKLIVSAKEDNTDIESFMASLTNIIEDIKLQPEGKMDWKGEMNNNLKGMSDYLKEAYPSMKKGESNKADLQGDFGDIIVELESCTDQMNTLSNEMDKKVFHREIKKVNNQCKKALIMLKNLQSRI